MSKELKKRYKDKNL